MKTASGWKPENPNVHGVNLPFDQEQEQNMATRDKSNQVMAIDGVKHAQDTSVEINSLSHECSHNPFMIEVLIDSKPLQMELDTSAAISLISETTFKQLWPTHQQRLRQMQAKLRGYTGNPLKVLGIINVQV